MAVAGGRGEQWLGHPIQIDAGAEVHKNDAVAMLGQFTLRLGKMTDQSARRAEGCDV